MKVELNLSNYVTQTDLKSAAGVDTSKFAKTVDLDNLKSDVDKLYIDKLKNVRTNLRNLKSKVDKLDVDKLLPVPIDLSKLSDVVKNDVVKKCTGFLLVGGLGGSPPLPEKLACPSPCRPTALTQKYRFCNFHAVFGHFAKIVPPTSRPHLENPDICNAKIKKILKIKYLLLTCY